MLSIKVPPLGESIVEATVSRWLKNEGDAVSAGETLVELETDKITVEVPALKAGVLAKRLKAEGDVVAVDDELGQLDESATAGAKPAPATAQAAAAPAQAPAAAAPPAAAGGAPAQTAHTGGGHGGGGAQRVSPAAQRTAAERGVDLAGV